MTPLLPVSSRAASALHRRRQGYGLDERLDWFIGVGGDAWEVASALYQERDDVCEMVSMFDGRSVLVLLGVYRAPRLLVTGVMQMRMF